METLKVYMAHNRPTYNTNTTIEYIVDTLFYSLVEICLLYQNSYWPNGSYFIVNDLNAADNQIFCEHSSEALNDGGWILPSGDPCTSTTSPMQCTNVATDGPTNIILQRVADFTTDVELVYKCCLPNDCSDSSTDVIIANIYSE